MNFIDGVKVDAQAHTLVENFSLPQALGFGAVLAPIMVQCHYDNNQWGDVQLLPYGPLQLDPAAKALNYGHQIFEGMKAYKKAGLPPVLFRPEQNWLRFNRSAAKLSMPEVPEEIFMGGVQAITAYCDSIIPVGEGQSLYIRPLMIATEANLMLDRSTSFTFLVLASPSASIFSSDVNVLIERHHARATPGGTGAVKVGGNYAAALSSTAKAYSLQCNQTLWLDSRYRNYVEELSGMNFFAVIDGELYTPELTDTILPGVTRDSIIQLAPELAYSVHEQTININELIDQIKRGNCSEAFACGTAAVIAPIKTLVEETGEIYSLKRHPGEVTLAFRQHLIGIQSQSITGPEGWIVPISKA